MKIFRLILFNTEINAAFTSVRVRIPEPTETAHLIGCVGAGADKDWCDERAKIVAAKLSLGDSGCDHKENFYGISRIANGLAYLFDLVQRRLLHRVEGTWQGLVRFVLGVIAACIGFEPGSTAARAQSAVQIVVETAILKFDPQPGMKTRQVLQVDFDRRHVIGTYETGTTEFFGVNLEAVRKNFVVEEVDFSDGKATFKVTGQAASGVSALPDIDYKFKMTVWPDGTAIVRGCHDGYPSYRVTVEGKEQYFFGHEPMGQFKLLGHCDVRLPEVLNDSALTITSSQIVPDGAGTGAIFFEASSRHAAVRLFFDDPIGRRTEAPVYAVAPAEGRDSLSSYAAVRRAAEQLVAGHGTLGAASSSIIKGNWSGLVQPISLPPVDLRFIVRADSKVVAEIDRRLKGEIVAIGTTLKESGGSNSYDRVVLAAARLLYAAANDPRLMVKINSEGATLPLPDTGEFASGLAWLLAYAYQSEGNAGLAGCAPVSGNVLPFKTDGDTTLLRSYLDVLAQANEANVFVAFAAAVILDVDGIWRAAAADTALKVGKVLVDGFRRSDFASFLALGHIDPARMQVARCKALRMLRGPIDPVELIVERSAMYAVASEAIERARTGGPRVRFFDAARSVTQLLGVGLVDLADDMDINHHTPAVAFSRDLLADANCIPQGIEILPGPRDRALLRRINAELLTFNQPRMRRLISAPNAWFDPVTMRRLDIPSGMDPALYFDLRMVVAEQYYVEKLLRSEKLKEEPDRDGALTAAEQALRCIANSALLKLLRDTGIELQHLDLLATVNDLLRGSDNSEKLPAMEQRFSSLRWRIAIGSAYVFALHRPTDVDSAEWRQEYVRYMRKLFDSMSADGRRNNAVPPAVSARIEGVLRGTAARWDQSRLQQVVGAAQLFLSPAPSVRLYRCEGSADKRVLRTQAFPPTVTPGERIERMRQHGASILALPHELSAEGGALHTGLRLTPANQVDMCDTLAARHEALVCSVGPQPLADCDPNASTLPARGAVRRFLFMEGSAGLRESLGHLEPFLLIELEQLPDVSSRDVIAEHVRSAARREAEYRRNLALAAILKEQSTAVLKALKVNSDKAYWTDLSKRAGASDPQAPVLLNNGDVDQAALAAYDGESSLESRISRIEDSEEALAAAVAPLLAAGHPTQPGEAESVPKVLPEGSDRQEPDAPEPTLQALKRLEPGETGLGFELAEVGQTEEDVTTYDAVLVYRRWQTGNAAAICASDVQGTCGASHQVGGPDHAIAGERTPQSIPLGLRIAGLTFSVEGEPLLLSILGDADIDVIQEQTRAALYELGMPRAFGLERVEFEVSRDLMSVTLVADLSVGGAQDMTVRLPLVRDGVFLDPVDGLKQQVVAEFEELIANRSQALNLDVSVEPAEGLSITFRLKPGSVVPVIDWTGGTLSAAAGLELAIGSEDNALVASANAELLFSRDKAALRQINFEPIDTVALLARVKEMPFFQALASFPGLSIVPEVAGERLSLRVRAVKDIEGCAAMIEGTIDLGTPAVGIKDLTERIAAAAKDVAICQTIKEVGDLADFLSGGEIDFLGFRAKFDFEALVANGIRPGVVTLPVEFTADQFDACDQPPSTMRVERFAIRIDEGLKSFKVDLSALEQGERQALGAVLRCRLVSALGPVSGIAKIGNVEIGKGIAMADLTLSNLPFLGETTARVDFADLTSDPVQKLLTALAETAETRLGENLGSLAGGVELAGVGAFRPDTDGLRFDLIESVDGALRLKDDLAISLTGILSVDRFKMRAEITFPLSV